MCRPTYRCVYVCDEGPIYFRAGVVDNTYELAKRRSRPRPVACRVARTACTASSSARWWADTSTSGRIDTLPDYKKIAKMADKGELSITQEPSGRRLVSDSISVLGYIDEDLQQGTRTTNFDRWMLRDHRDQAKEEARVKAGGKPKKEKAPRTTNDKHSYYEVYNINDEGQSRIDDLVMKQALISGHFEQADEDYIILFETFTIGRDYIDKKEFKQTRKENEVEMDINELRRLEQNHHIPPLAPNLKAAVDELFKKELNKN